MVAVRRADIDLDDVIPVPNLWDRLKPTASPFTKHSNFGGGFVHENDRVAVSSIYFGSTSSTGATDRCTPSTGSRTYDGGDATEEDVRCLATLVSR
jgi:hypothetical protein